MVLPIVVYGNPVLKIRAMDINPDYPELDRLISDMWETMEFAKGVGLAAPQIGLSIRMFVVDSLAYYEKEQPGKGIRKVFINPSIINESGSEWAFEEGCLSIPKINADVVRKPNIRIKYFDQNFREFTEEFDDLNARIIQHEYDHLEGILFIDRINPVRRKLIQKKLDKIKRGIIEAKYPVKN